MENLLYLLGFFLGLSSGALIGLVVYNILDKRVNNEKI